MAAKLRVTQLAAKGLDGANVAIAIMDTGINLAHLAGIPGLAPRLDAANSWSPPNGMTLPGRYPVDHGTMCAFDALIAAPNATLLDYPMLASSIPGGNPTGRSLSAALLAFSHLLANWAVAFAPGGPQRYSALVVNNSWGIYHPSWDFPPNHAGRYCDNPNHPFHVIADALAKSGADILFAAGNCGSQCPDGRCQGRISGTIMGANTYQEVLTLAGCDTNDQRVGYSSQGPSIPGMAELPRPVRWRQVVWPPCAPNFLPPARHPPISLRNCAPQPLRSEGKTHGMAITGTASSIQLAPPIVSAYDWRWRRWL